MERIKCSRGLDLEIGNDSRLDVSTGGNTTWIPLPRPLP